MPRYSFIYLASQSPRRKQLLEQLGVNFELLLPLSEAPYKPFNVVLIPNLSIF